jgi:hypothetical protein
LGILFTSFLGGEDRVFPDDPDDGFASDVWAIDKPDPLATKPAAIKTRKNFFICLSC